ncbi:hypothetical protein XENOCAPTIV_013897 [Xenoophorus captivus]|uniref:Uncharacterized protein n=1 Tax=Xenoophorus captivus TaxID=1517983 RepID=A0ABV0RJC8_9TELE
MLTGMDTEDFLSSLLDGDDNVEAFSPSHSPLGSDSGISDDSSTGAGNNNALGSPHGSESDIVPSPVNSDPGLTYEELQTESPETLSIHADHSYSLLQNGARDMDVLESVRSEKPDTDVFIDLDDLVSDAMEEDFTTELPCTLAIENCAQDSAQLGKDEQFKEIVLTEEEKRLLAKEGATIPEHMPLTKVFLLSFCLIIFPSVNPFGRNTEQKEAYTPSSVPSENTDPIFYLETEEDPLVLVSEVVENSKAIFSGGQKNHTPDYQRVEQADSETGVNSNSSADFPSPAQAAEMKPGSPGGASPLKEGSIDPVVATAVAYDVPGSKDNWIDRSPPSVILQQHRSDEM